MKEISQETTQVVVSKTYFCEQCKYSTSSRYDAVVHESRHQKWKIKKIGNYKLVFLESKEKFELYQIFIRSSFTTSYSNFVKPGWYVEEIIYDDRLHSDDVIHYLKLTTIKTLINEQVLEKQKIEKKITELEAVKEEIYKCVL